jgi:hypothetical protein
LFEHQPYTLALATKMATVAETEGLDLLHVHYAIPHSISAILARESLKPKRRLPVITTLHGTDITLVGADRSYLPITRYGIVQSDGVTAISNYLKEATKEIFHFDDIKVIPNFVCPEDYTRHANPELRQTLAPNVAAGPCFKFSAGQTAGRLCGDTCEGAETRRASQVGDGRRRQRENQCRASSAMSEHFRSMFLRWKTT